MDEELEAGFPMSSYENSRKKERRQTPRLPWCGEESVRKECCLRSVHEASILMQVVDARDPLRYWSEDLQALAHELHPAKASYLLLNKADLLPRAARAAWADYLVAAGIDFCFWSAKAASEDAPPGGASLCTGFSA